MSLFLELAGIFINIVMPVFVLVLLGALAGRTLELEARTMTRYAYYLLAPAFVLNIIGDANVSGALALRMIGYIVVVEVGCALLGYGVARLLGRSRKMIGAYILVGVFGNVGNFGLPIIEFRLGTEALVPATVYFLAVSTTSFIIGVAAAGGSQGGVLAGVKSVVRTPALVAIIPALLFNMSGGMPVALERIVNLLAGAMIPTMLATLGVQLGRMQDFHFRWDMLWASGVRLIGGPLLAFPLVALFGLTGLERGAGILQASMPSAVLASIIALEYDLLPDFVTTTVLFSTVLSLFSLTVLMAII